MYKVRVHKYPATIAEFGRYGWMKEIGGVWLAYDSRHPDISYEIDISKHDGESLGKLLFDLFGDSVNK